MSETKTEKATRSRTGKASGMRQSSINRGGNLRKANTSDVHDAFGIGEEKTEKDTRKWLHESSGKATKFDQQGLEFLRSEQVRGHQYIQKWRNENRKRYQKSCLRSIGKSRIFDYLEGESSRFREQSGNGKNGTDFAASEDLDRKGAKERFLGYLQRFRGPF
ncbi:MAG TPA: hypothetical protein VE866_05815 [Candidatus Binatia bacterium]|nr:hypothetical protein [Candidatus Binatia bacterium]